MEINPHMLFNYPLSVACVLTGHFTLSFPSVKIGSGLWGHKPGGGGRNGNKTN